MRSVILASLIGWHACLLAGDAAASCGAAFCSVNTDWRIQGVWTDPGWQADLRFEYVNQDQPMAGSEPVAVGQIRRHHDEVDTVNRNWVLGLNYNFESGWGVAAQLPYVSRDHEHIHNHHGAKLDEQWDFDQIGDLRLLGRVPLGQGTGLALLAGAKLPTGRTDVANGEGEVAERSLQPGTGSTDAILGVNYFSAPGPSPDGWFVQALADIPVASRDGYRPGNRYLVDLGWRHAFDAHFSAMIQGNLVVRARDEGAYAEPRDSGGQTFFISPGLSYDFNHNTQIYGFAQLPVYQHVNGVQLTAGMSVALGISQRF